MSSNETRYVPLLLTGDKDLYLRPENIFALETAGILTTSLVCISDIPQSRLADLGASFALVDHNRLLPMFGDAPVRSVIDHHADEKLYETASPRIVQVTGSCSSLVTNYFTSLPSPPTFPSALCNLLLSAILIDTSLKPEPKGKATQYDEKAASYLLPLSSLAPTSLITATGIEGGIFTYLEDLSAKKFNVSTLTGRDLLRRDYKEYEENGWRYGLSTVPASFEEWLAKSRTDTLTSWNAIESDVEGWKVERKLDMVGVLTSFNAPKKSGEAKGKHRRELLLYLADEGLKPILEGVEKDSTLDLKKWKGEKAKGEFKDRRWKVYEQGNAKATRKQLAPILSALVAACHK